MASTGAAELLSPVPWARLKAWIDDKVAYERTHDGLAPVSRSEREALSILVPFVAEQEPELDNQDYVSHLMRWTQMRHLPPPTHHDIGPISVPVRGIILPRWRNVCELYNHGSFPRLGYGIDDAGQQAPAFQAKKKAKQYVAKCALEYLQQPARPTLCSATAKNTTFSETPRCQASRTSHLASASSAARGTSPCSDAADSDGGEGSSLAFGCAEELAIQVGLGSLYYQIESDSGLFVGGPVFEHPGSCPARLGCRQRRAEQEADNDTDSRVHPPRASAAEAGEETSLQELIRLGHLRRVRGIKGRLESVCGNGDLASHSGRFPATQFSFLGLSCRYRPNCGH